MNTRSFIISGAGSGIGRAIAVKVANADSRNRVILLGRNAGRLSETLSALPNAKEHKIIAADVGSAKELKKAIHDAQLDKMNLCGIVSNAGIGGSNHYGENDRWDEIIQTNLTGTYRFVQECLPALKASSESYKNIVVVSSILAKLGVPGYSAYCASKAGLLGLTRSWAAELARDKILVNAINPGWVDTDMARSGINAIASGTGGSFEDALKGQMDQVPLGKMSAPSEIAELIYLLLDAKQTSITGQTLDINNGALMN